MPVITSFGGVYPRTPWHQLPEKAATIAHDVKLRNSKLEAWREKLNVGFGVQDAKTLVTEGCCMLTWDMCIDHTEFLSDYGRSFITGRSDRPEVMVLENCVPAYLYLGVPEPMIAPRISGTAAEGRDCSARTYVYTFVNIFGEESAPSPASRQITVQDGSTVSVLGMETPPMGWGVTHINIYRTATAFRDGSEKEQEPLTDYLLVTTLALPETNFTDTLLEKYLGPALNTREVRVPPQQLRQINHIDGTGTLAGVTNNQVHFSANFQPHNWPAEHDLTLPHNIVHMVTVDQFAIVSTDSYPYVISAAPNCEARRCRGVEGVDIPLPDIGCGYAHSAIATPFGMVYSSKDGLVLVTPKAEFQIITAAWFSTDDWVKIRPDTARLAFWRGYLICVTDIISFMLEIDGKTYQDFELGSLVTISDQPIDMYTTSNGELLFMQDRIISQWNAGITLRPYIWESRELSFGGKSSPNTAKVRTNDITFRLLTPQAGLYYERHLVDEEPFRLGRLGRHLFYRVGFYGTGTVDFVEVGMSNTTVNAGQ